MKEIRSCGVLLVVAYSCTVQLQLRFDLVIARHEDPARLPMARFEVRQHCLKLLARGMLLHPKHFVDETSGPTGGDLLRLPGNMKRANDYPRGISVQHDRRDDGASEIGRAHV